MAWFTVQYRGADGKTESVQIESADRPGVFAELKRRGITAIRVEEAKGKVKPAKQRQAKSSGTGSSKSRGLIAGAIVVALGLCALLFVSRGLFDGEKDTEPKKPTKTAPAKKTTTAPSTTPSAAPVAQPGAPADPDADIPPDKRILKESYTIKTNGHGKIIERFRTADGKSHMVIGHVEPVFEAPSDQLLAMAMGGRSDGLGAPPPMPGGVSNEAFLESLKKEIVINDDDSEAVRELKQKVIDARAEVLEMVKEGSSLDDILAEHHKLAMENDEIRRECQQELKRLVDSGDMEGAQKYRDTMSLALSQMGIAELRMPMTDEERAELIERRKTARAEAEARRAAAAAEGAK